MCFHDLYIQQVSYLVPSIISQPLAPKPPTLKTYDSLGLHGAWEEEEEDRRTVHSSSLVNEHLQDTFPPSPRMKIKTKNITLRFKIVHITNTEMQMHAFSFTSEKDMFTYLTFSLESSIFVHKHDGVPLAAIVTSCCAFWPNTQLLF